MATDKSVARDRIIAAARAVHKTSSHAEQRRALFHEAEGVYFTAREAADQDIKRLSEALGRPATARDAELVLTILDVAQ